MTCSEGMADERNRKAGSGVCLVQGLLISQESSRFCGFFVGRLDL